MKRLFYVNEEEDCSGCKRFKFNFTEDEWEGTDLRLSAGVNVVVNGTEMIYVGNGKFRDLVDGVDEELWDGSVPESVMIEAISYSTPHFIDRNEDQTITPRGAVSAYVPW